MLTLRIKARPLLALIAGSIASATVTAPAVAGTFFAYTAPLAAPLRDTAPQLPIAAAALLFTAAACAAAFLPAMPLRGNVKRAPATPAASGPVWCDTTRRWRDPVIRRFVKAPIV